MSLCLLAASPAVAQTNEQCMQYMWYREARGEQPKVGRAVIDVMINRQRKYGLSACQVLRKKGQYPYMRKSKVKQLDKKHLSAYNTAFEMEPVLGHRYIYFNHKPHSFGKKTKKIGGLYFSQ